MPPSSTWLNKRLADSTIRFLLVYPKASEIDTNFLTEPMMQRHLFVATVLVVFPWVTNHSAHATDPSVAIVAAATNSNIMSERFTDLRDVLVADGRFSGVDIISTTRFGTGTPALEDLLQYDAIIHWTNDSNDDAVALGNVFANYVDTGRGLVQAVFANTSSNPDRFLQGRWLTGGYNIIPPNGGFTQGITASGAATETAVMDTPLEPNHPIFDGVGEVRLSTGRFSTGGLWGAYRPTTTLLEPGSRKLALWEDGKTAVAVSEVFPQRVELGLHPVSDRVVDGYYDITSDTPILIANSLLYAASFNGVTGDFNGDSIYDCLDIDALVAEIVAGTNNSSFDLTGDSLVDIADRDAWLAEAGAINIPNGNPYLPSDFNLDSVSDGSDFIIWNENKFTVNAAHCGGDANVDGFVDGLDFIIWNKFPFQPASVPEPATSLALIWLALGAFHLRPSIGGRIPTDRSKF